MNPLLASQLKRSFEGQRILLGISGSIAAFKSCDIIRLLRQAGAEVRVVPTKNALHFVTKTTLETLSGNAVHDDLWNQRGTHHIDAARWATHALIAPATANTIAKMAHGLADDLLSTEILAFEGPLFVAPAMNPAMFSNLAMQDNLKLLSSRGVKLLGPTSGLTSCGEEGLGRMLEPEELLVSMAIPRSLSGKRILLTLGPTRSALDPVRFVSNRSSGLMGAHLCWEAVRRGYEVTVVSGPCEVTLPPGVLQYRVETAKEMFSICENQWPRHDVFISAAAVLDWDVANPATQKLKKLATNNATSAPSLLWSENPDILATLCKSKTPHQKVWGFAAETESVTENGTEKFLRKGCDALFANDVSKRDGGFEAENNSGYWISRATGEITVQEIPSQPKANLANTLFGLFEKESPYEKFHAPHSQISQ